MTNYELLGHFYLGKLIDPKTLEKTDNYLLYDSRDLTTHAICLGMTGSGKTGLGITLLEEAAIDNIPALVIDPKGDMANLLLNFPELKGEDFLPWIQASEAERAGLSLSDYAEKKADEWRTGLAAWDQGPDRIRLLKDRSDFQVYTPGSSAGKSLSIAKMLDCPNEKILSDQESLQDYLLSTIDALLSFIGVKIESMQSREHTLLSRIILDYWEQGKDLNLAQLIQGIADPRIESIGVFPLESFFPKDDRMKLALRFNNLLAAPQFSAWLEGDPIDINNMLYGLDGHAKISIVNLSQLNDQERMFFVSLLLNQVLAWMRAQQGTSSLRAILYMDEIFGYFPPVANPPSKQPLLTLLKQARAYGLGLILASQNPSDLDYKGLANIGTWFIGRLQTDQDKSRLLDGLQTANQAGGEFSLEISRAELSDLLSRLPARSFLMNNVHESAPLLFATRWCLSYLAGPLSKDQIRLITQAKRVPSVAGREHVTTPPADIHLDQQVEKDQNKKLDFDQGERKTLPDNAVELAKPDLPAGIDQYYIKIGVDEWEEGSVIYRPSIYAYIETNYEDKVSGLFTKESSIWNSFLQDSALAVDWTNPTGLKPEPDQLGRSALAFARYAALPDAARKKNNYNLWSKELVDHIYRNVTYTAYSSKDKKLSSRPGESQGEFLVRLRQYMREQRDEAIAKVRDKYSQKISRLEERVRKAEQRVEKEKGRSQQAKFSSMINIGNTILDTLVGRKGIRTSTLNKAARSIRSAGRSQQRAGDVARAEDSLAVYQADLENLERELEAEIAALTDKYTSEAENCQEIQIKAKKQDILVKIFALVWLPYQQRPGQEDLALFK